MIESDGVTQLLLAWNNGDESALNRLIPLVEAELRQVARRQMRHERPGHLLQTTALVNEVYLKLVVQEESNWNSRAQFFGVAAKLMRNILVDHARKQLRSKRGGGEIGLCLDEVNAVSLEKSAELIALDEAMDSLAKLDPLKSRIVELRHFGGLTVDETAEVLKISPATVNRHWRLAKAWLGREVRGH